MTTNYKQLELDLNIPLKSRKIDSELEVYLDGLELDIDRAIRQLPYDLLAEWICKAIKDRQFDKESLDKMRYLIKDKLDE